VEDGKPVRVATDRGAVRADDLTTHAALALGGDGHGGGVVTQCAGPWRTAGHWWGETPWDRDEWDVTLGDGTAYRVFRDRRSGGWFVEGLVD
jgi:hypothetical protein